MNHSNELNRRSFLKTTATAALATGALNLAGRAAAAPKSEKWSVGCRDVLLKFVDKADGWAALKQLNADCFEAGVNDELALSSFSAPGKNYSVATPDGIGALQADLKAHKRRISAFCMHNRFDERLEKEIELASFQVSSFDQTIDEDENITFGDTIADEKIDFLK